MKPQQTNLLDYSRPSAPRTPGELAGLTVFYLLLATILACILGLLYEWWTASLIKPW